MKPSSKMCAFLQEGKGKLIEIIHEALSFNMEPTFYHPFYLQIDDLIKEGRKNKLFITNNYSEQTFWDTCQNLLKSEKMKVAHGTNNTLNLKHPNFAELLRKKNISTQDLELVNKHEENLVMPALKDLITQIRKTILSSNKTVIMSESKQVKELFLAHCYFVTSPVYNQKMYNYWQQLLQEPSAEDHPSSIMNPVKLPDTKCFVCHKETKQIHIHMENVHCLIKEKCKHCGKLLKNQTSLTSHLKNLHESQINTMASEPVSDKIENVQKLMETDMLSYAEFMLGLEYVNAFVDQMEENYERFIDQVVPIKKRKTD